jgi:outer membrane lipoprotein-sorting protein
LRKQLFARKEQSMMASRGRVRLLGALVAGGVASLCGPVALWAADNKAVAGLTAEQIVEKHVAARGGLAAWHAVQTMSWTGKMDAGVGDSVARSQNYVAQMWGSKAPKSRAAARQEALKGEAAKPEAKQVQLPFVLEMKRPGKSRIELEFAGKTAIQVYDGKAGWMKRPYLNRDDWEPFNAEQAKASAGMWDMDGPLIDYAAKGTKVALEGVEKVDGNDAYKLKLTLKGGTVKHVWIDQKSFLDVKVEGTPQRMDGKVRTVWVTQRDFRPVQGVMLPFELQTVVDGYPDQHKMQLEKVAVNPQLDDNRFKKPGA